MDVQGDLSRKVMRERVASGYSGVSPEGRAIEGSRDESMDDHFKKHGRK